MSPTPGTDDLLPHGRSGIAGEVRIDVRANDVPDTIATRVLDDGFPVASVVWRRTGLGSWQAAMPDLPPGNYQIEEPNVADSLGFRLVPRADPKIVQFTVGPARRPVAHCPTCGAPDFVPADPGTPSAVLGAKANSQKAAYAVLPKTGTQRRTVLAYIAQQRGRGTTDEEAQIALNMTGNTYRPRRGELAEGGWIRRQGMRTTRGGNDADVWILTDAGRARLNAGSR